MKGYRLIVFLAAMMLVGCAVKKDVTANGEKANGEWAKVTKVTKKNHWHTCVIQGAKATVTTKSDKITASVTMQAVHDSLIIISVMPALGIEMVRLEATPDELLAFDKVHNRYAKTTFKELNKRLKPKLTWKQLEQICSAEMPGGKDKLHLEYSIGKDIVQFDIKYPARKIDGQVKMNRLKTNKYKQMDISKWL